MLETPLTYQGGKQRIARQIIDIIVERNEIKDKYFYDLCCGSGAITLECINRKLPVIKYKMLDWSVWGDFWKSIGEGSFCVETFKSYIDKLPEKESIQKYLEDMSKEPAYNCVELSHVYRYLLLQAGSFGGMQVKLEDGKWKKSAFRSYWLPTETSNRRSPVNPMMPMPETLFKRIEMLSCELNGIIDARNDNIENYTKFRENSIIYVDPPYMDTAGYKNSFDIIEWVAEVKKNCDVKIYVSEQKPLGNTAFLISEKRSKGNISGNSKKGGIEEWLTEF
jgi:site-specific DNA-adenine methylase